MKLAKSFSIDASIGVSNPLMGMKSAIKITALVFLLSCQNKDFISCEEIAALNNLEHSEEKYELLKKTYDSFKGKSVYNSELLSLNGDKNLLYDISGKVTVLNFWFTTCKPCIEEIPYFNELKTEFKEEDVSFISLARNKPETVLTFLNQKPRSKLTRYEISKMFFYRC